VAGVAPLEPGVVYLTPTGRLCRLYEMDQRGGKGGIAKLCYVRRAGAGATGWKDGFCLSAPNWRILTRVA